jgi:hypothetical protein
MFPSAAMKYGFAGSLLTFFLIHMASPILWGLFWGVVAAQTLAAGWLTWRRTGLRWYTINMFHGAMIEAALVPFCLAGYSVESVPMAWKLIFAANAAIAIAMNVASQYEDRDKTARWKAALAKASWTDFLTFRHIPNLR